MFGGIGYTEMFLFGVVALMLYGSRLPEVARNLGGTYRTLKKSVDDFKREFEAVDTYQPPPVKSISRDDESLIAESSAPRFTPPPKEDE